MYVYSPSRNARTPIAPTNDPNASTSISGRWLAVAGSSDLGAVALGVAGAAFSGLGVGNVPDVPVGAGVLGSVVVGGCTVGAGGGLGGCDGCVVGCSGGCDSGDVVVGGAGVAGGCCCCCCCGGCC